MCYFPLCAKFKREEWPNSVWCVIWPHSFFCINSAAKPTPDTLVAFEMNGEIVVLLPVTLCSERDGLQ